MKGGAMTISHTGEHDLWFWKSHDLAEACGNSLPANFGKGKKIKIL
jgi:hypothetical protein